MGISPPWLKIRGSPLWYLTFYGKVAFLVVTREMDD